MADLIFGGVGTIDLGGAPGDVLEFGHDAAFEIAEGSVAFSFNAADTDGQQGLFSKDAYGYGGGGNHFAVFLDGDRLKARFQDGSAEVYLTYDGIAAGRDYEIAATFGAEGVALWVDGVLVASDTLVMDWRLNAEAMQWGGRGWASDSGQAGFDAPFEGTIADPEIYSGVLSAEEIAALAGTPNAPPAPRFDSYATQEDTPLSFAAAELLENDSDPDGGTPVFLGLARQPYHGSAAYDPATGLVTYAPDPDFSGTDSFTAFIGDGQGGSSRSRIDVEVAPVNDAPVATDDAGGSVVAGRAIVIDLIGNDRDADGDALAIAAVTGAALGTVTDNGDGTVTYAAGAEAGPDSFGYTVADGKGGTATATVSLSVLADPNTPPVARDDAYALDEDTLLAIALASGVLANDSDADGDGLRARLAAAPLHGTLTLNGDGSFSYAPDADFHGSDSFTYRVTDGKGGTDLATARLTVAPVNDAPLAADDTARTAEGAAVLVAVLGNDSDADGDALSVTLAGGPANGTAAVDAQWRILYTPAAGFAGTDSFGYRIADGKGGTDTATVAVTVGGEAGGLVSDDFSGSTLGPEWLFEGIAGTAELESDGTESWLQITSPAGVSVDAYRAMTTPRLLQSVEDGDFQVAIRFLNEPDQIYQEHGILVLESDTRWFRFDIAYTPGGLYLLVGDVDGVSRGFPYREPVAPGDALFLRITRTGTEFRFEHSADGTDWITAITLQSDLVPAQIGPFAGSTGRNDETPPGFVSMFDWFESAADPILGEDLGGLPPVAADDYLQTGAGVALAIAASDLLANDSDPDGDLLSLASYTQPAHGTLAAGPQPGDLVYTPAAGFSGIDSFTYAASDGSREAAAAVLVSVMAAGNTAPVARADAVATSEDMVLRFDPAANDSDAEGDALAVFSVGAAAHGAVVLNADGTVSYTPDADYAGPDSFGYAVADGRGGLSTGMVDVAVTAVNDPPSAADAAFAIDDDAPEGSVAGRIGASDPEGQALSYRILSGDPAGIFSVDAAGRVTVADAAALAAGGPGSYALRVEVSDSDGAATVAAVTVAVTDADLLGIAFALGAMEFGGTAADAVILPHDPVMAVEDGALAFAFEAGNADGRSWLLSKDASGYGDGGHVGVFLEDGRIGLRIQSGSANYELLAETQIAAGSFHHAAVSFGAAGLKLFLDGTLEAAAAYAGGIAANAEPLVLGATQWSSSPGYADKLSEGFDGVIHGFELYGQPLSGADAAMLAARALAPVPGAPLAVTDLIELPKGAVSVIDIAELLANDSDPGGDTLAFQSFSQPSAGTLADRGDGTLAYTPPADFEGLATFAYTISDGTHASTAIAVLDVSLAVVAASGADPDWRQVSTGTGWLPRPATAEYTAAQVFDANGDGLDDYIIAGRKGGPAVTLYLQQPDGRFAERVIEPGSFDIEAGGTVHDIDGDGDLDLVLGGDSKSTEIWWWENPGLYGEGDTWQSHVLKTGGANQQHDMAFGDFDGDGTDELAFWNQKGAGNGIYLAEIPADPTQLWPKVQIYDGAISEGMDTGDIDGDGILDIVVGGYWLKWQGGADYLATTIDAGFPYPQTAVGDLDEDGRLDVVISSGDADGPLMLYTYSGDPTVAANWTGTDLLGTIVDEGHSLEIADLDEDGHLDIFVAEMNLDGQNPGAETWALFGDGTGSFEVTLVATGADNHESTLGDLDGDGDLDILGKGFHESEINIWYNTLTEPVLYAWNRTVIDGDRPYRAIFEEAADLDGDGLLDIVTGGWWYRNPGTIGGDWVRMAIGAPLNNLAAVFDLDGDGDLDILGTQGIGSSANSSFAWAENDGAGNFTIHVNIADAEGAFLQGTTVTRFSDGGPLQVVLSWQNGAGGTQVLTVPDDPASGTWAWSQLSAFSSGEGLDAADIDGDGDNDILTGFDWLRNDGGAFTRVALHQPPAQAEPDRVHLVDMDSDGDLDALVGYGHESSITTLAWYEQGADPEALWAEHAISNQLAGNPQSVDVFDLDGDGDMDVVAGEHLPADPGDLGLHVFENLDGAGSAWGQHLVYEGDEHHDGAQLADLDNDGDMDIYSIGWTHGEVLVYENLSNGF
ncbi:Ig-like domain-containing protein [Poseidonocella sp. HB161398]|uniref:Ig-like domain-containing protein n=1 Tax=Poseidonocella sp. HB161398 TaxID=2320855 RepID=UPI00148674C3|nr:Ig-like domain-containing protein [Poseidonocella sp. HB161398]